MPSMFSRVVTFARSPRGKQLIAQAKKAAQDPKNRQRLEELRRRRRRA